MKNTNIPSHSVIQLITSMGLGGAERVVAELSLELLRRGVNLKIVSLNNDTKLLSQYPDLIKKNTIVLNINGGFFSKIMRLFFSLKLIFSLKATVIHAHLFHALVVALLIKFFSPSLKIVFTSHSFEGFSGFRGWILRLTKRFRYRDIIFSTSQHIHLNAKNTSVIPNFAPYIKISQSSCLDSLIDGDFYVFAFVGRMNVIKNPLDIIFAFYNADIQNSRLVLVGGGPLLDDAFLLVEKLNLSGKVLILGPRDDVHSILTKIDVLVLASKWEGLPMIILEAGSLGIPVIAPSVGAIADLLSDNCGYICDTFNLSKKMLYLFNNKNEAILTGGRLKRKIDNLYSIDAAVEKHLLAYKINL